LQSKVRTACKDLNDRAEQIHKLAEKLKMLGTEADGEGDSRSKTRLASAFELLGDPLLPVRGHGLIELTKLVDEKDDETVKSIKKVVDAFKVGEPTFQFASKDNFNLSSLDQFGRR
jgi:hypothetical protein